MALVCQYRERLMEQATDPSSLERLLRHLPKRLVREPHAMDVLEDVIGTALLYMYVVQLVLLL